MPIRMTGLTSGLDTESIVGALMEAQKAKKTKVENKKTKLEWSKTIWSDLNTKLKKFYTDYAGKLRMQSNYKTKKVTSSNSSVLTATAKSTVTNGSYRVQVNELASAQFVTSGKLQLSGGGEVATAGDSDNTVTSKTKLSELGFPNTVNKASQIRIQTADKTVNMYVDGDTTVGDLVQNLKDAGLNASFDEKQGRFFISSPKSGADGKFTIVSNTLDQEQALAMTNLQNAVGYDFLSETDQNAVQGIMGDLQGLDMTDPADMTARDEAIQKLIDYSDKAAEEKATAYYKNERTEDYLRKYIGSDGKLTSEGQEVWDEADLPSADGMTQDQIVDSLKEKVINDRVKEDISTEEYQTRIQNAVDQGDSDAGVDIPFVRSSEITNAVSSYVNSFAGDIKEDDDATSVLRYFGLGNVDGSKMDEKGNAVGMAVVAASDATAQINGATITGSSNTIEVNGLTLDLTGVSDSPVTVNVLNDASSVYDMVKDFVDQYNSILSELNKYYYADSARGYEPLTDDQKEAMSDDEVEKWEEKIKGSLLRRDTTLGGILSGMRAFTAYTVRASNGKTYSLANLGITTGKDYKEYGLLHIKGDEDDTDHADDKNTLMSLLEEDPDTVMEVLSGITKNLYDDLGKKMQSSTMSSSMTFYNDKEMDKQLSQYNKDIKEWETKLADMEDRYYKQFTAMEKALASLQSQQSSLASYLGG